MISFISSFEITSAAHCAKPKGWFPNPKMYSYAAADATTVNTNGIKALLAYRVKYIFR